MLLERYGLKGRMLETLVDLHETTKFKERGKESTSSAWVPARVLTEGCSTSPIMFNIYHQAVMRQVGEARAAECGSEVGVEWRWIPGSSFEGKVHGRGMGE